jgi:hypothetical protein
MEELATDAERRALMGRHSQEHIEQYSPEAWAAGMANAVMLQRKEAA